MFSGAGTKTLCFSLWFLFLVEKRLVIPCGGGRKEEVKSYFINLYKYKAIMAFLLLSVDLVMV